MTDHTYWVSVGRNVGTEPMSEDEWEGFQRNTVATILAYDGAILSQVEGSSVSQDWTPEATALYLFTVPELSIDHLRLSLGAVCRRYGQDAIGFVGGPGTDTLIRP